jgi:hypothetical protein
MALVSQVYPPEIWALESLGVLRDNLLMARLVRRDFENAVKNAGDKVHTRKPVKMTAKSHAGQTGTEADSTITVENPQARDISVTLDTHIYTAYLLEDRDAATSLKDLVDEFILPALDPIAQRVDDDIMTEFCSSASVDVEGNAITAVADDTVGLGAGMDVDDIIAARLALNNAQCPLNGRVIVLCPGHEANLLGLAVFHQANTSGSTEAIVNANLGRKFGFDVFMSQNVPDAVDTDTTPQSLAFHRDALCLVTRPLMAVPAGLGARSSSKDLDGISIRVTEAYSERYMGVTLAFDILYGVQLLDAHYGKIVNP